MIINHAAAQQWVSRLRNHSLVVAGHGTSIYASYSVAVYPRNTVFWTKCFTKMDILDVWEEEKTAETPGHFFGELPTICTHLFVG